MPPLTQSMEVISLEKFSADFEVSSSAFLSVSTASFPSGSFSSVISWSATQLQRSTLGGRSRFGRWWSGLFKVSPWCRASSWPLSLRTVLDFISVSERRKPSGNCMRNLNARWIWSISRTYSEELVGVCTSDCCLVGQTFRFHCVSVVSLDGPLPSR